MNLNFLDFEQPIAELQAKIEELRLMGAGAEINIQEEIERLEREPSAAVRRQQLSLLPKAGKNKKTVD